MKRTPLLTGISTNLIDDPVSASSRLWAVRAVTPSSNIMIGYPFTKAFSGSNAFCQEERFSIRAIQSAT